MKNNIHFSNIIIYTSQQTRMTEYEYRTIYEGNHGERPSTHNKSASFVLERIERK